MHNWFHYLTNDTKQWDWTVIYWVQCRIPFVDSCYVCYLSMSWKMATAETKDEQVKELCWDLLGPVALSGFNLLSCLQITFGQNPVRLQFHFWSLGQKAVHIFQQRFIIMMITGMSLWLDFPFRLLTLSAGKVALHKPFFQFSAVADSSILSALMYVRQTETFLVEEQN